MVTDLKAHFSLIGNTLFIYRIPRGASRVILCAAGKKMKYAVDKLTKHR
jgi:hypothetical protein